MIDGSEECECKLALNLRIHMFLKSAVISKWFALDLGASIHVDNRSFSWLCYFGVAKSMQFTTTVVYLFFVQLNVTVLFFASEVSLLA